MRAAQKVIFTKMKIIKQLISEKNYSQIFIITKEIGIENMQMVESQKLVKIAKESIRENIIKIQEYSTVIQKCVTIIEVEYVVIETVEETTVFESSSSSSSSTTTTTTIEETTTTTEETISTELIQKEVIAQKEVKKIANKKKTEEKAKVNKKKGVITKIEECVIEEVVYIEQIVVQEEWDVVETRIETNEVYEAQVEIIEETIVEYTEVIVEEETVIEYTQQSIIENKKKIQKEEAKKPVIVTKPPSKPVQKPKAPHEGFTGPKLRPNDKRIYTTVGTEAYLLEIIIKKIKYEQYITIEKYLEKIAGLKKMSYSLEKWLLYLGYNLEPATRKCEAQWGVGRCENVWNIMVAQKCPEGYMRYGCCTCVIPCPEGYYDNGELCRKSGEIKLGVYPTLKTCRVSNPDSITDCGLIGQEKYSLDCPEGMRNDNMMCYRTCPEGWPEINSKYCMKLGTIRLPDRFVWSKADGQVAKKKMN